MTAPRKSLYLPLKPGGNGPSKVATLLRLPLDCNKKKNSIKFLLGPFPFFPRYQHLRSFLVVMSALFMPSIIISNIHVHKNKCQLQLHVPALSEMTMNFHTHIC